MVVLGPTGRNFAAGMSGGIAYVYDPSEEFPDKVNDETVDLESLEDADEEELVRELIEKHVAYTDSEQGKNILNQWESAKKLFVKVMPTDYKRALLEMEKEETTAI